MPRGWLIPWLAICLLGEANALAVDNSATSAMAVMRVLKRVSKESAFACCALLGARVGLGFMFGSSLVCSFLLIPCHAVALELQSCSDSSVELPDRSPAAAGFIGYLKVVTPVVELPPPLEVRVIRLGLA